MSFGLRLWDADGNLTVDTTTSLTSYIGQTQTGTSDGSVTVSAFSRGIPWYVVLPINASTQSAIPPDVSISGTTLSWSFQAAPYNCLILYGTR